MAVPLRIPRRTLVAVAVSSMLLVDIQGAAAASPSADTSTPSQSSSAQSLAQHQSTSPASTDSGAPQTRSNRVLTAVIVIGNVAGLPLQGARVRVTTTTGRPLAIVGGEALTNAAGIAHVVVPGMRTQWIASLTGGRYGYPGGRLPQFRRVIDGFGRTSDNVTYVSPETQVAVSEFQSGGSSIAKAVRSTSVFFGLPTSTSPLLLGSTTGAQGRVWNARRFYRAAQKAGGPVPYARSLTNGVGVKGLSIKPRMGGGGSFIKGLLTEAFRGWFTGGIGNLISAGVCAATGQIPGVSFITGLFAGCGGDGDGNAEVLQKLDEIQASLGELKEAMKGLGRQLAKIKEGDAWRDSKITELDDALHGVIPAIADLSTVETGTPGGLSGKSDSELCATVYKDTQSRGKITGQTARDNCELLAKFYRTFAFNPVAGDPVANNLFHALAGQTGTDASNLIARSQDVIAGSDRSDVVPGKSQLALTSLYASLIGLQQRAFLAAITWARFKESWTSSSPCNPIPALYPAGGVAPRFLQDSCVLAATAWYDLSVERYIIEHGPATDISENVLIDPKTGYSWWRYAFDATGYSLRANSTSEPFFAKPESWTKGSFGKLVYGSASKDGNKRFALPNNSDGSGQKFTLTKEPQVTQLIEDVRSTLSTPKGIDANLAAVGFEGPGKKKSDAGSMGMNWSRMASDPAPYSQQGREVGRYEKTSYTYPGTDSEGYSWGRVLDPKTIGPCDTRRPASGVSSVSYLWPYLGGSFECTITAWGDLFNFRARAITDLSGVWARHFDGPEVCPAVSDSPHSTTPLCTADTYGLLVDPTNALWSDHDFLSLAATNVPANVMLPFVSADSQSNGSLSYRVSSSQNGAESGPAVASLQCSTRPDFPSDNTTSQHLGLVYGKTPQVRSANVANSSGKWCRITADNSVGQAVSGSYKIA